MSNSIGSKMIREGKLNKDGHNNNIGRALKIIYLHPGHAYSCPYCLG